MCECAKMLKACWDCAIGNARDSDREVAYGAQLNGGGSTQVSTALPPWPTPQYDNETMFLLPRSLKVGDRIDISATIRTNPQTLFANLVTGEGYIDYENIACQLAVNFNTDNASLRIIQNGQTETLYEESSDMFAGSSLELSFVVKSNSNPSGEIFMDVFIRESAFEQITLKHNLSQIRYLTLSGDVEKVNKLTFEMN